MDTNEQELFREQSELIRKLNARISYLEDRLDFYLGLKESNIDINCLPLFGIDKKKLRSLGATLV